MKNFCTSSLRQKLKFSSLFFGRIEDTKISFRDQLTFTNWISARKCTYFLSLNRILFHFIELSNANSSMSTTYKNKSIKLNPNWHEAGRIYPPYNFRMSAEFLSKISKHFWRWKLRSIGIIWHPAKLIESYKTCF